VRAAEPAALDELLELGDCRVVDQQVAHDQQHARVGGSRTHGPRVLGGQRQRLLDEDVLAGVDGAQRQ